MKAIIYLGAGIVLVLVLVLVLASLIFTSDDTLQRLNPKVEPQFVDGSNRLERALPGEIPLGRELSDVSRLEVPAPESKTVSIEDRSREFITGFILDPSSSDGRRTLRNDAPCLVWWDGNTRHLTYEAGGEASVVDVVDGKKEGESTSWFPNGQLTANGVWANNRRVGIWEYYFEGGVLAAVGEYCDGLRCGQWFEYYRDGTVKSVGAYWDRFREGEWMFFEPSSGAAASTSGLYVRGVKVDSK